MNTFTYEGRDRIYFGAQCRLVETEREIAASDSWAQKHIKLNPAHSWVLGKFVEADRPNLNQQYFSLEGLQMGNPLIAHSPMNLNHNARNIIGAFVASELIYPTQEQADDGGVNPFIESLGAIWKYYFPDEYRLVQRANAEGMLFYSMECVPRAIATIGGTDDSKEYVYEGRNSPNYPDEVNERSVPIHLLDPHFVGGALIIPPEKPGWSKAEVKQVANFMQEQWEHVEMAGNESEGSEILDPRTWESLMGELILLEQERLSARTFTEEERQRLAKKGQALPDGSFPIANAQDLKNAIQAIGRAKNPAAAKAHIKKRAAALGLTELIPEEWR